MYSLRFILAHVVLDMDHLRPYDLLSYKIIYIFLKA
uniref:Uncharacterized protein n=1 Tax=Musa acuminata subsp. malaccensis TaxID=214687 RepID=A0A804K622_MUSAM